MAFDWKSVVKTIAPALGTALGTPAVGAAVKVLGDVILGDSNATEDTVAQVITDKGLTADQIAALQERDYDFRQKLAEAGIRLTELENADRQNARDREIKTGDRKTPAVLAFFVTLGFFLIICLLAFVDLPVTAKEPMFILVGALASAFVQVLNYYFGSSSGSDDKNKFIHSLIKNN